MEYIRARREARHALIISDPQPVANVNGLWTSAGQAAIIGIFLLLFGSFLYVGREILVPILIASVVSLTLAPAIKTGRRHGIPPWLASIVIVVVAIGVLALAASALAAPVSEWIGRAPEIGAAVRQKLAVFEPPLAALRVLEKSVFGADPASSHAAAGPSIVLPVVAFVTPAAGELLLFFGTLVFFLAAQIELRAHVVSLFGTREAKLRFLRIMNDIEKNLASYLITVTTINAALGALVAIGAWLIGYPEPVFLGLVAAVLNYIPYIGPAIVVVILFAVGLVIFPVLGHALVGPICFVALTTAEGHFITPAIVGRRITLSPLVVILSLSFWTWLWGPVGAFLAAPLCIVGLVVTHHLLPHDDVKLPE